jgi:hypothetical protein
MRLRVHIERLVLEGPLSVVDGRHVEASLARELSRLLSSGGLHPELHAGTALPAVLAGAYDPPRDASASQIGEEIARSVHAGIGLSK